MNNNIAYIYPANSLQQGFIYYALSQPDDDAYRVQFRYDYDQPVDIDHYIGAWQACIAQYPVLRTAFDWEEELVQVIYRKGYLEYSVHDLSDLSTQHERDAQIEIIRSEDRKKPFHLDRPALFRLHIIKQAEDLYTVIKTRHHSIADGWSGPVLLGSAHRHYQSLMAGKKPAIHEDTAYLEAQEYISSRKSSLSDYWEKLLAGVTGANDINAMLSRPVDTASYRRVAEQCTNTLRITGERYEQLRAFSQKEGVTVNVILQFAWHKLLQVYSSHHQTIVGTTVSGRDLPIEGIEHSVGLYINTLPLILNWENEHTILAQLHYIQERLAALNAHGFADLAKLQKDGQRLFHSLFVFENYPLAEKESEAALKFSVCSVVEKSDYLLSILASDHSHTLTVDLTYDAHFLAEDKARCLVETLENILHQVVKDPHRSHGDIVLLDPETYHKVVYAWNETAKPYSKDKTIHELFQEQVDRTPHNIAVACEDRQLTYEALNEKSNQLARHIRDRYKQETGRDLTPDTLIALCVERSLEMLTGILGILKAGGAYVPVDPQYPAERIRYMLEHTQAAFVLTQRHLAHCEIGLPQEKLVCIDLTEELYRTTDSATLLPQSTASDLAYVIYTSGSTGKPKGVALNHSGIVNRLEWMQSAYLLSASDTVVQKTPFVFDVAVWELLWANWYGAKIVMAKPEGHKESDYLFQLIRQHKVTVAHFVPPMLEAFNHYLSEQNIRPDTSSLRLLFCSGSALPEHVMQHAYKNFVNPGFRLHNLYGPTEASIDVTSFETSPGKKVCIGRPIQNVQAYVLDKNRVPVPIGVAGELYIGGAGLARCYVNREDLTAERLITNPFQTEADRKNGYTRLYKTGDLVRWLPEGDLEYIGRNDDQVKIQGYRIEPGEIEHVLSQIGGIRQSCVLVKERQTAAGTTPYLVGYYVPYGKTDALTPGVIREQLAMTLPEYMIPNMLVAMESFPLTISGKLDKRAFPDPDIKLPAGGNMKPVTALEASMCRIWEEVLMLKQVGVTDDFFRIGGNSILAIQVAHRMSKTMMCEVRIADVFQYRTVSQLIAHSQGRPLITIPATYARRSALSFAQERLWFIEQYEQGTNAYHMPAVFELAATTEVEGLKYAVQQVVARHEVLRSTIAQGDHLHTIQTVHEEPLSIPVIQLTAQSDLEKLIREDIDRTFDLATEYPIRVKFYRIQSDEPQNNRTILSINIHHIANDGWSTEIFQRELFSYYEAYVARDTQFSLPPLEIQYKDYAAWQRTYLTGDTLHKQLDYWKTRLAGHQPLAFPADYTRPNRIAYKGDRQSFTLSSDTSARLRRLAKHYGVTLNTVLLSSINILLSKYTGQDDIVTGAPTANRHHRQTQGLIGFFVNMQVNRTLLNKNQTFEDLIKQVHQEQIAAQLYQDLPFEKLVDELDIERDTSRHPIFQVMFVVQSFGSDRASINELKKYFKPLRESVTLQVEKFDLSIFMDDSREAIMGQMVYATSLFHPNTISRMIGHYTYLLEQLVNAPRTSYSKFGLLPPNEYQQIVLARNNTAKALPQHKTIHEVFQDQVKRSPDRTALIFEGMRFTYQQMNERSNQLARQIKCQYKNKIGQELSSDTLIALHCERAPEMIIGMLAILKAGGAYVPVEPGYPRERLNFILRDSGAALMLTHMQGHRNVVGVPEDMLLHISLTEDFYQREDRSDLVANNSCNDLAYVIYTSGTTGKPKGVMIDHTAVLSLACNDYIRLSDEDTFAFLSSPVFDAATFEIWTPLLHGNTLVIPADLKAILSNARKFDGFITAHGITVMWLTKTLFENLYYMDQTLFRNLNYLIIGGEALEKATINKVVTGSAKPKHFINGYGPTESTTFACTFPLEKEIKSFGVPIGKPINNRNVYVLDAHLVPVPTGVIGELYIGGAGLARGYLNNKELTDAYFITDPFFMEVNGNPARLYKTGDMVRWLSDGNLEYVGRNDSQVKIRGYRIELSEVEYALLQVPGIKQGSVLVRERETASGNTKYLTGYYVLDGKYVSGNDSGVLNSWERLYDSEYAKVIDDAGIESDFSGWNSYITGRPIPLDEMESWRNDILSVIKSLNPSIVLEVGVGSGLLMYPLLKDVQRYVGLDISTAVIDRHKQYLEDKADDVRLYHLRADQVDQVPETGLYDTIIINSVCQYFPSILYFDEVLDKVLAKLSSAGSIFLGDIRNYSLHRELIKERLEYKNENYSSHDIDRIATKENELLISPDYFTGLEARYENISIRVLPREGSYRNELSKYRYDTVISATGGKIIKRHRSNGQGTKSHLDSLRYNIPYLNQLSKEDILKQLADVLPDYMVPAALVPMESFPVTLNGKLDVEALPEPGFRVSEEYVAPISHTETLVCDIWQEILGLASVGVTDDFFKIGGNSILAIRVSHEMSKALGYELKVSEIFRYKTPAQIVANSVSPLQHSIPKTEFHAAPLSFAQERLWFFDQYEEGRNTYHMPVIFELAAGVDIAGMQHAIRQIVFRHEILRSTIEQDDQQRAVQVVHQKPLPVDVIELSASDDPGAWIAEGVNQPFDLSSQYPIRVRFYKMPATVSAARTILLINMHHIASDGWSLEIFTKELSTYYKAYVDNSNALGLPALEIQYKDYALWQRSYLTGRVLEIQLHYWKTKLQGYQNLELPTDHRRPHHVDHSGASEQFRLNAATSRKLRALSKQYGATLHSLMLSSVSILLGKYTGQEDIVIGSPIANRHYRQTESLIGFFVNTLVNRILLEKRQTFEQLVHQVHRDQVAAQSHQDLPFEKLVDELNIERDPSRHPIFQVWFAVQNFADHNETTRAKAKYFKPYPGSVPYHVEKFDLSILINANEEEITGSFSYATSLFTRDTIAKLINHYIHLLDQLMAAPTKAYSEMSLLLPQEYNQIIYQWNQTGKQYSRDKTIHALFAQQAGKTPSNIAVIFEGKQLTYAGLHQKSNQLARHIRNTYRQNTNMELRPDTLIALCLDRCLEMMIGILGILKAGGAYVPIDPDHPQERIDYLLNDTNAALVLTRRHLNEIHAIQLPADKLLYIDLEGDLYHREDASDLPAYSTPADLAYVIYTSGTTGKPKGVMIDHSGIVNRIEWMQSMYPVGTTDAILQKTPFTFDVSVWELLWANWYGAKIVLAKPDGHKDSEYLHNLIHKQSITTLHFVPSMLDAYNLYLQEHGGVFSSSVRQLICSGEALHERIVQQTYLHAAHAPFSVHNLYGPTEASIDVTFFNASANGKVYIGKPIQNTQVFVLDSNRIPVPAGVTGELYLGGAGLTRGYLNNPDLTCENFIDNVFAVEAGSAQQYTRLYKTGDLVRWSPDGDLEYIGRNDSQVKIRGYRIELGEVEQYLIKLEGIAAAVVAVKESKGQHYLCAYYVSRKDVQVNPDELRGTMVKKLPHYMIPSHWIEVNKIALSPNGKVDRNALPAIEDHTRGARQYVAPRNEVEIRLMNIWQELLGRDRISVRDNFFELGGQSIKAVQLLNRVAREFNSKVGLRSIFSALTIETLAHEIEAAKWVSEGRPDLSEEVQVI